MVSGGVGTDLIGSNYSLLTTVWTPCKEKQRLWQKFFVFTAFLNMNLKVTSKLSLKSSTFSHAC